MRIFKNKRFNRWAVDLGLSDNDLIEAINEINQGLYDANLGGNIYKKRISVGSRGKRGGARTIIAYKKQERVIFVYGFAKNKRDNITDKEEEALKALAKIYFGYSEMQINRAVKAGELIEV